MKTVISGSSGLIGSALASLMASEGYQVMRLVRNQPTSERDQCFWDPAAGEINAEALEGIEAVVHLAGENVASRRWSKAQKERIRTSRVEGTRLLSTTLANLKHRPRVLACASATGYYGDRGGDELDEASSPGQGFLPEVCRAWEAATEPARQAGIRVVHLRFGVILSRRGGALTKMLWPFRLGLGGRVGSGQQYLSWIVLADALGAIRHVLEHEDIHGPVNVVAPNPVTNKQFTRTLARVLGRPALLPMPAFMARLLFGEMAQELLLASTRVLPHRLQETNYHFEYPDLEEALRHLLGKPAKPSAAQEQMVPRNVAHTH